MEEDNEEKKDKEEDEQNNKYKQFGQDKIGDVVEVEVYCEEIKEDNSKYEEKDVEKEAGGGESGYVGEQL